MHREEHDAITGGGRFRIIRQIGSGGMGVVYEAEDHERSQRVALKALRNPDVEAMYWLKREFRALADIAHPNLVTLYDLVVDEDRCFFTMELVDGVPLLDYCKPDRELEGEQTPFAVTWGRDRPLASDEAKLRTCLEQLTRALAAVHDAGKLHCDIKPGNLLVTRTGRVVLLDFGLAEDIHRHSRTLVDGQVFGTVAYMSPEQASASRALTPASDWYSVGAVLYEALTGQTPFTGSPMEVLSSKQEHAPAPPHALVAMAPEDLDDLCVALLSRAAERRPGARDVLRRLGVARSPDSPAASSRSHTRAVAFAGRTRELDALMDRFYQVASGNTATVVVRGHSGIGKSALIREFLRRLDVRYPGLVVLEGRCYEHEHIPYRAMDALIDDLSRHWTLLPRSEAEALMPDHAGLLPRLFPVLGRVPVVAAGPAEPDYNEAREARAQATAALREVLSRLARSAPTALYLDDMQWVDADTVNLLSDVLREPDSPKLMLLFCSRIQASEHFERLCERLPGLSEPLELAPLSETDALTLARRLLGDATDELVARVAAEAAGSPFFLDQIAHYVAANADADGPLELDRVIATRIATLPEGARGVLEAVSVAGHPIAHRIAASAADLDDDDMARHARLLRSLGFVRTAGGRDRNSIEPYHDRVREATLGQLFTDQTRAVHRALALAFERWNEGTPDNLARHWYGAGDAERAADHARSAADAAMATLDFEHAARLYQLTLELDRGDPDNECALFGALGEALASTGRHREAAAAFLEAAANTAAGDRLDLRRRSAHELLRGGHLESGLNAIRGVLADIGMRLPRSPRTALLHLLVRRAWLRVRGFRWRWRHRSEITSLELSRVDACWSVASSLSFVDPVFSGDYITRHLLLALRTGEPTRVARSLTFEACQLATLDHGDRARKVTDMASELADRLRTPYATSLANWAHAAVSYFCDNHWPDAFAATEQAASSFRHEQSAGWETDSCRLYSCFGLLQLGELRELGQRVHAQVRAAQSRGELYHCTSLRSRLNIVWLVADDPTGAERDLREAMSKWTGPPGSYQLQHLYALFSGGELELYRDRPDVATKLIEQDDRPVRRSLMLRIPLLRAEWLHLRARVALARAASCAPGDPDRAALVKQADRCARKLERKQLPLGRAFALLLRAGIANLRQGPAEAASALGDAIETLDGMQMNAHAAAARYRLGQCTSGQPGRVLCDDAEAWFRDASVVAPTKLIRMYVPGW